MHKSTDPALFWIGLSSISGVGRVTFRKMITHFGSPERALCATRDELDAIEGLSDKVITAIGTGSWREFAEQELAKASIAGVRIITADCETYPDSLKKTPDPPLFLYVKGRLDNNDGIAVVGTRKPTYYGSTVAYRISYQLAAAGMTVVSGMARGIDTQAHRGALAAKGRTIAVLACGIDVVYPPENKGLMADIIGSGAVVTENPFGTKPEAGFFPARNRIISGLSRGTVIAEATEDSGSLITADYTREQGRLLFAVPGNIGAHSKGANSLLRQGAILVEGADDILRTIGSSGSNGNATTNEGRPGAIPELSPEEETVFKSITNEPKHIDALMHESGEPPGKLSAILINLELKGLAKQLSGKYYVREEL